MRCSGYCAQNCKIAGFGLGCQLALKSYRLHKNGRANKNRRDSLVPAALLLTPGRDGVYACPLTLSALSREAFTAIPAYPAAYAG